MISKTAEYAIRAMAALNQMSNGELVGVGMLSKAIRVPANYLSKIMHTLGRAGLVDSVRGPGGGFRVAASSRGITAFQIVQLFDDLEGRRRCFLGNKTCSAEHACAAHEMWAGVWNKYEDFLHRMTLDRLAPPLQPKATARRASRK